MRNLLLAALVLCTANIAQAQLNVPDPAPHTGETKEQFLNRTKWWREAKFGMFIHWGVYAVPADATTRDGKPAIAEWYLSNKQMQMSEYEQFAERFNPVKFDAKKWVATAKNAGMKYIVITSKHHDGFAMFGTKMNHDWNIVDATPFKRDPIKELAAECKKQGVKLCFYHSIMDWHHPDYLPRRPWEKETRPAAGADPNRYFDGYMKAQLKELLTNYGPIGVMWFDGEWEPTWTHERGLDLDRYVRSLQPNILVNNRVDKGRSGMQGMNSGKEFAGDFGTPEQEIPPQGFPDGRLWESCMTMNDTWGYARNDHNWKSAEDLIHKLCDIAHKGGNFLLNVGPNERGEFPQAINERLATMGAWTKVHGAGIYATTPSPFKKLSFDGRAATKGNTIYLHVFKWPSAGLRLDGLKTKVVSARTLDANEKLNVTSTGGALMISRPNTLDEYATTVELKLAGKPVVEQVATVIRPAANGTVALKASDAEIHGGTAQYETAEGKNSIGYWTNASDFVTWTCAVPAAARYAVEVTYACDPNSAGSAFVVAAGSVKASGVVESTGSWSSFKDARLGAVDLPAGKADIAVRAVSIPHGAVMNLREVRLVPVR